MEPLGNFKSAWKPDEPSRLDPIYVERTSLRDALAAKRGLNPETILGTVELVEPTFQVQIPPTYPMFPYKKECFCSLQYLFSSVILACPKYPQRLNYTVQLYCPFEPRT